MRAAARLGIDGPWLGDAETYLLNQQQPDGSFGLLAAELAQLDDGQPSTDITLRLTVEVLWTLAELATRRSSLNPTPAAAAEPSCET